MNDTQYANHREDCVFCKIASGSIAAMKIYEDDQTLSFLDVAPTSPGHVLVIPKDHFENIYTLPPETLCRVALTVQKVATAVRNAVNADGINIIMNNEAAAGQVVFHSHIHVIPRHNDDGLKHWPHTDYKEGEADEVFKKITEELKS